MAVGLDRYVACDMILALATSDPHPADVCLPGMAAALRDVSGIEGGTPVGFPSQSGEILLRERSSPTGETRARAARWLRRSWT
jgi:hypothetical protein